MNKLIKQSYEFAEYHHRMVGQRRKYTNEPYIIHPASVAKLVKSIGGTPHMIAAANLHDTLEDTNATLDDIVSNFGKLVGVYVNGLTDASKPEDGNRAARKLINNIFIGSQCDSVKTIKLADRLDNLKSIIKHDPKFSIVYLQETSDLLPYLKEGNKFLYNSLHRIVYG